LAKECVLTVFAPINDVKPVQEMTGQDFVIRCCSVQGTSSGQWNLDPKPFQLKEAK